MKSVTELSNLVPLGDACLVCVRPELNPLGLNLMTPCKPLINWAAFFKLIVGPTIIQLTYQRPIAKKKVKKKKITVDIFLNYAVIKKKKAAAGAQ